MPQTTRQKDRTVTNNQTEKFLNIYSQTDKTAKTKDRKIILIFINVHCGRPTYKLRATNEKKVRHMDRNKEWGIGWNGINKNKFWTILDCARITSLL